MKKHIPNLITLLNLFCGSIAVIFAVQNQLIAAVIFAFLGIFFDFFDGLVARKLKVQSELGIQLDSLADAVTSGLVPGLVMYQLLDMASSGHSWELFSGSDMAWYNFEIKSLPLIGLIITLAAVYRLAKFNVSGHMEEGFIGLPTPANSLLVLSFPLIMEFQNNDLMNALILNKWFLIAITIIGAYLMNSKIRLLDLKFKNWSFKDNAARYILIIFSIVLILILKFSAIPIIILIYILGSLLNR